MQSHYEALGAKTSTCEFWGGHSLAQSIGYRNLFNCFPISDFQDFLKFEVWFLFCFWQNKQSLEMEIKRIVRCLSIPIKIPKM